MHAEETHRRAWWCTCAWKDEGNAWTERRNDAPGVETGWLGREALDPRPESLRTWAKHAMETSKAWAEVAVAETPSPSTVHALDRVSDAICQVLDATELLRNVHQDPTYASTAQHVCNELNQFVHELNANPQLHRAVQRALHAMQGKGCHGKCETFLVGESLKLEFEIGGVHLPPEAKRRWQRSQKAEHRAAVSFSRNLTEHRKLGNVEVPLSMLESHLPMHVLKTILERCPSSKDDIVNVTTDSSTVAQLLKWIPDERIRQQAYLSCAGTPVENQALLDSILVERSTQARLLGYDSYSKLVAQSRMAKNPAAVAGFLDELSSEIEAQARSELAFLRSFKKAKTGNEEVAVWDYAFYSGMAKAEACSINAFQVSAYFHIENCVRGMGVLAKRLFGLEVHESNPSQEVVWAEGVKRLDFYDCCQSHRGTMYLDLYPRPGKFNHAAHFTVRCGMCNEGGMVRPPIVALVCNFQDSKTHLLAHQEVETLFHEYGHAMHSLLSQTRLQHLSGTRGALDFVEIPSHLFEHFVWDHSFLRCFARHYKTLEVIPRRMVEQLRSSKRMFQAMDMQTQIVYAVFDHRLHAGPPAVGAECSALFQTVHNKYSVLKQPEGSNWHLRFGHLVNYGGTYYCYVVAKILSKLLWEMHFEADPLSEEAGKELAHKVLGWGGARDPSFILQEYIGQQALEGRAKLVPLLTSAA